MTGGELSVFRHDSLHYGRQALEEIERLREREAEADRLLRAAYADAHPEDVPCDVLMWLNPDA